MAAELISIEPLRDVIRPPLGIFCDIDGTLAPIVRDPATAAISPQAKELLERLMSRGAKVALVSGRQLEAARRMAPVEGAAYAGNHGLQVWMDGREETMEPVERFVSMARELLAAIGEIPHPGVEVEDKGPVLAFHYRNASEEGAARAAVLRALEQTAGAESFGIYEGRKVIELRPPLEINKGTAVVQLAQRLGVRSAIAIGDDLTDVDMFRGVALLEGMGIPGATVAVWSDEAPTGLLEATDYYVNGVEGVEWLLGEILRELPG